MFYAYVFAMTAYILFLNFECYQSKVCLSVDKKETEQRYINNISWLTQQKQLFGKNPICSLSNKEKKQICREIFKIYTFLGEFVDSNDDLSCVRQTFLLDSSQPVIELEEEVYPCYYGYAYNPYYKKWITQGDEDTIYMFKNIDSKYRLHGYITGISIPPTATNKLQNGTDDAFSTETNAPPGINVIDGISLPPTETNKLQNGTDWVSAEINAPPGINYNSHHNSLYFTLEARHDVERDYISNICKSVLNPNRPTRIKHNRYYFTLDAYEAELEYISNIKWRNQNTEYPMNPICSLSNDAKLAICAKIFQIYRNLGTFHYYKDKPLECETRALHVCLQKPTMNGDSKIIVENGYPCYYGLIHDKLETQWITQANQDTVLLLNNVNNEFHITGYATGINIDLPQPYKSTISNDLT